MFLKMKHLIAFRDGLKSGVLAYALESDYSRNSYLTKYEQESFRYGYLMSMTDEIYRVWKTTPDNMSEDIFIIQWLINNNKIECEFGVFCSCHGYFIDEK